MKCKEIPERILREKPQRKTRLINPQSYTFNSSNSSTLTFSIDIPLRGSLARSLPHHIHISEKVSWCLGSNSRENQFILVDAMGLRDPEKTRLGLTLLEQET